MRKLYILNTKATVGEAIPSDFAWLDLSNKGRVELVEGPVADYVFGVPGEAELFWNHARTELRQLFAPLKTTWGMFNFFWIALIAMVVSIIPFLGEPLFRGWRLRAVRNVAENASVQVPSPRPDLLFWDSFKGTALIIAYFVYFLPMIVVIFLSGMKMFNLLKEIAFYLWDFYVNAKQLDILAFFFKKVLPQLGVEIIVQLVVLTLYMVLVWPVYRLIMVQYALGKIGFRGFFKVSVIRENIGIFLRNASMVYGIYSFSVAVDVIVGLLGTTISVFSFGLLFWLTAVFYLLFRHWVKGYAYGRLGRELIARGEINLN